MRCSDERADRKKVVIIGGGPAGLTAGYDLSRAGVGSVVLEKDSQVGGISKTVDYKGYHFDLGGHRFFTKVKRVEDMWNEILKEDFLHRSRLSRILYNGRFFDYPLKPMNALFGLGIGKSLLIFLSYLYVHLLPAKKEESFEDWVTNRFGKRLYRTFFKTYTEKVWGIPCTEIRAEWAAQRIKGLSLLKVLKNSLIQQGAGGGKKKIIKTLIKSFHYPKFGPGMMWQAVKEIAERNGLEVRLDSNVRKIIWKKGSVEAVEVERDGNVEALSATDFISSMPVRELISKLDPAPPKAVREAAESLKYRDFLTVALIVDKKELFPDNWIYVHDPGVKLGRIQNFKNWSPQMVPDEKKTCLGLEYFCFEGDELWTMDDEELVELGKTELEELGLVKGTEVVDAKVVRVPKAYPIYDSTYKDSLEIVKEFLANIKNLQLIGRNGMHKYNNQDHSMLTAMFAVENVLGAGAVAAHDLWEVNVEQEYHEEISESSVAELIPDQVVKRAFSRLDNFSFAMAVGTVSGLVVFLSTLILALKGGEVVGANAIILSQYFVGYTVTVKGALLGLCYSFVWGFLFGWLFSYLRNMFLAFYIYRVKKEAEFLSFRTFFDHY